MERRRVELLQSQELAEGLPRARMEWTALLTARDKLLRMEVEPMASLRHPAPFLASSEAQLEDAEDAAKARARNRAARRWRAAAVTEDMAPALASRSSVDVNSVSDASPAQPTTADTEAGGTSANAADRYDDDDDDDALPVDHSAGKERAASSSTARPLVSPENETANALAHVVADAMVATAAAAHHAFYVTDEEGTHRSGSPLTARFCVECAARGQRTAFTAFRGRHLCSNCGQAVCGRCCTQRVLLPSASEKPQRVCGSCHRRLTQQPAKTCVRTVDASGAERVYWLVELPSTLWRMTTLVELHLESTHLAILPAAVDQLAALQVLNLAGNRLTSLPASIGNLRHLVSLLLGDNSITHLPSSCARLVRLNRLDLARNTLAAVPEWLECLISLEHLDLSENAGMDLESLAYLGGLPRLTHLHLRRLHIAALPLALWTLTTLEYLNVNHNAIEELPRGIGLLTELAELRLADNRLRSLPLTLGGLENLRVLILSGNSHFVPPALLGRLRQLQQLSMAGCGLQSLPATLGNLVALEALELQDNGLTSLPWSFQRLVALRKLTLHNNPCHIRPSWSNPRALLQQLVQPRLQRGRPSPATPTTTPTAPLRGAGAAPPPLTVVIWPASDCETGHLFECLADDALLHAQPHMSSTGSSEGSSMPTTPVLARSPDALTFGIPGRFGVGSGVGGYRGNV
jgi:Leucine-rich repeat (LRR) protein